MKNSIIVFLLSLVHSGAFSDETASSVDKNNSEVSRVCGKAGSRVELIRSTTEARPETKQALENELKVLEPYAKSGNIDVLGYFSINLDDIAPVELNGTPRALTENWCIPSQISISIKNEVNQAFNVTEAFVDSYDYTISFWAEPISTRGWMMFELEPDGSAKIGLNFNKRNILLRHLDEGQYLMTESKGPFVMDDTLSHQDVVDHLEAKSKEEPLTELELQELEKMRELIDKPNGKKTETKDETESRSIRGNTTALVIGIGIDSRFLPGTFNFTIDGFSSSLATSQISNTSVSGVGFNTIYSIDENASLGRQVVEARRDPAVLALQKDLGADVIILYSSALGVNGISTPFADFINSQPLIAGVAVNQGETNFTMAHELGHVYGAGHDEFFDVAGDDTDPGNFSNSRAAKNSSMQTVMYSPFSSSRHQLQYSATGITNVLGDKAHDNKFAILSTTNTISRLGQQQNQTVAPPLTVDFTDTACIPNQHQTYIAAWSDSPTPVTHYETGFGRTANLTNAFNRRLDNSAKFNLSSGHWHIGVRSKLGNRASQWVTKRVFVDTSCGNAGRKPIN